MSIFRRRRDSPPPAILFGVFLLYLLPTALLSLQTPASKKYLLVKTLIQLLDSYDSEQNNSLTSSREQHEINKCDGLIETPYGGFISYPGMGLYENDLHCSWWISAPKKSQVVKIKLLSVSVESRGRTCDCDRLEVFDVSEQNSTTHLATFCGFRVPTEELTTTESSVLLRFTTDESIVYGGFLVYYSFVDREQKPAKESCSDTHVVIGSQGQINFADSGLSTDYFVCGWKIITPLGTQIQIKVNLRSATAHKTKCPEDVFVVRDGSQETLRCLCNDSGSCTYPLSTNNTAFITSASSSSSSSSSASAIADFELKYRAISRDRKAYGRVCDGQIMEVTGSGGLIQSPDYGLLNYPKNIRCTWTIKADPGKRIEFTLLDIDVEPDKTCQYDRVTIFNGCDGVSPSASASSSSPFAPSQSLGRFCGTKIPSAVSTVGPNATVTFESDGSEEMKGFILKWKTFSDAVSIRSKPVTGEASACNGKPKELNEGQGVIASPKEQWGNNYPPNKECQWKIVMPAGMTVSLVFERFSLEPPSEKVCYDSVKICDGPDQSYPSLGSFCGNDTPPVITSSSNQLFVLFVSDKSVSSTGFLARYSSISVPANVPLTPAPRAMGRGKADVCGVQEVMPLVYTRIVGGVEAIAHSWPWMASIRYVPKSGEHWCGGAIIGSSWIITAAHCCHYYGNASNFLVVVGGHNMAVVEGTEMTIGVEKIYIHPNYEPDTNNNDLAILKLSADIPFGRTKKPVCVCKQQIPDGTLCVVTGWGDTRANGSSGKSNVLNQLNAPIISRDVCNQKGWYSGELTKTMLCAGFPEGMKDSCQGDSGGPLIRQVDGQWCLIGVTSWGFDCAQPNHPGVYTVVALFTDWIAGVTGIATT